MMKQQRKSKPIADRSGVWLNVSVYLILIVFFIVLNGIATPVPSKTKATAEGLSLAFSGDTKGTASTGGKSPRKITHHEQLVIGLSPLFQEFGLLRLEAVTSDDGPSYYKLPRDLIFRERSLSLRDRVPNILDAIDRQARSAPRGYQNGIIFWLGVGKTPLVNRYSSGQEAAMRRANTLSRVLDPRGSIVAGIYSGDPEMILVEVNSSPIIMSEGYGR